MVEYNMTQTGFSAMSSMSPSSAIAIVTLLLMGIIVLFLFFVWRNFRRFLYGLVVLIPLSIIYYFSKNIAVNAVRGDGRYLKYSIIIFIISTLSITIGFMIENTKWGRQIEKMMIKEEAKDESTSEENGWEM